MPHSPTLEIREGAIDLIMTVYRQQLPRLGRVPVLRRQARLCEESSKFVADRSASHEEAIFQKRARTEQRMRQRQKQPTRAR